MWEAGGTLGKSLHRCVCVRAARFSADPARKLLVCLLVTVAACFLVQPTAEAQAKEVRRVLFLCEEGPFNPYSTLLVQEIHAALDKSPYQVETYIEYLQNTLFPDAASQQEIRAENIRKYRHRQPDLIITIDSFALKFMLESHEKLFPGIPIVFCGGSKELVDNPKLDSQFAGVWWVTHFAKTLDAALLLQPRTKHVVVVTGAAEEDRRYEALAREELRSYEDRLEFTYLSGLEMPVLLERLKRLPKDTIILFITSRGMLRERASFEATQAIPMIIAAANAPVFVLFDVCVGQGTVGGYAISFAAEAQAAAGVAMRVLQGERPQDIPVVEDTSVYMFDWRALRRWGLRESDLPGGATVLYRQPSAWEQYKWWISGALGLVALESLLIVTLLINLRRRRRAEESLKGLTARLLQTQDEERRRMARDLHDGTAQDLAGISLCLGELSDLLGEAGSGRERDSPTAGSSTGAQLQGLTGSS